MSPAAVETEPTSQEAVPKQRRFGTFEVPDVATKRMEKAGIDLSQGYPEYPAELKTFKDIHNLQPGPVEFSDPGARADREKKALFGAAKEVRHLTYYCGTEIVGLQLKDLNPTQLDELALLVAERGVVFFRNQDLSPQQQRDVTGHFGPIFVCSSVYPAYAVLKDFWTFGLELHELTPFA
jgi:hypothetical protein